MEIANKHDFPTQIDNNFINIANELQLIHPDKIKLSNNQLYSHQTVRRYSNEQSLFVCPSYSATETYSATQNYVECIIPDVCPGDTLTISDCSDTCVGDQQYNLYDGTYNLYIYLSIYLS